MDVLSAVTVASKGLGLVRSLFSNARQAPAGQTPGVQSTPGAFLLEQRDADGDGMLSASELGMKEAVFKRLDLDGDGFLSIEELNQAAARHAQTASLERGVARYMELHDANLDDRITLLESGLDDPRFGELDVSEDGFLARNEVARGLGGGLDVRS